MPVISELCPPQGPSFVASGYADLVWGVVEGEMGWDGMGWDGMGWDGMERNMRGWVGQEWDGIG